MEPDRKRRIRRWVLIILLIVAAVVLLYAIVLLGALWLQSQLGSNRPN